MIDKLMSTVALTLVVAGFVVADEIDAVVDDGTRQGTNSANAPERFVYGRIWLDAKGKILSQVNQEGRLTKDTKIARGAFDEKQKKWVAGDAIEGGVKAAVFKDFGKWVRVRVTVADDGKTIRQILMTNSDAKMERASEFDAILKDRGRTIVNGRASVTFAPIELDEKGRVINTFALVTSMVTKETKVAMGKYNEKEHAWEAGADIPNGVYGEPFKDPGAKNIYIRITYRADFKGIDQVLLRQIGDKGRK